MSSIADIAGVIAGAGRVLISGHVVPDGDSIGSTLGLKLALQSAGKLVTAAGQDPVPWQYKFLPGAGDYQVTGDVDAVYDTFIALDCSIPERLGEGFRKMIEKCGTVVNIDHHLGTDGFGAYRYIDTTAAATGEIIFDLMQEMNLPLTPEIAVCLYIAIVTDTGSFRYDNTGPGTHRRVARLIEAGVPVADINSRLYEEKPLASLKLLGASLNNLTLSDCGRVAWMTASCKTIESCGATEENAEGVVNYARDIAGVLVGLFFREISPGKYKVSFRSKGSVEVNKVASLFGGGGHRRAAGCVVDGDLEGLVDRVVGAILHTLQES
ncbi:MAG: DHH family phosphoesterase [Eubacteriales bacterium]